MNKRPRYFAHRDAIMRSTLGQSEKDVLHAILAHMSFRRGARKPCPSEARIGLLASVGERTVRRVIVCLEERGVLHVKRRHRTSSEYTIVLGALDALADPRLAAEAEGPGRRPPWPAKNERLLGGHHGRQEGGVTPATMAGKNVSPATMAGEESSEKKSRAEDPA